MEVVVVNDFAHVNGGAAAVALGSAIGLSQRGRRVRLFSAVPPVSAELEAAGVEVVCSGQHEIRNDPVRWRAVRQGIWNARAGRILGELLDTARRETTVVHVHGWSKALSSSVIRAALNRRFKVICTLHDYFAACPNGGFFDYQSLQHCTLKPMSFTCVVRHCDVRSYPQKLWRTARQLVQEHVGKAPWGINNFIVISRLSRDILRPYLPKLARLFTVTNPVDVRRMGPVDVARNRMYTFVGRLATEKGGVLLARAARESSVPAMFVGDGPGRSQIAAACPAAVITGWVSQDRVRELLAQARALVFPSVWYETQGLAVLEAAARGVPAIVSDGCAASESIEDGVTGLLFRRGDGASLAAALMRMQDDAFAARLGRASYERFWSDPPTLEKHVDRLIQVYNEILGAV